MKTPKTDQDLQPKSVLIARGWSEKLIDKHLGSPDGTTDVPIQEEGSDYDPNDPQGYDYEPEYETVPAYSLTRVREIEQSEPASKELKAHRFCRQEKAIKDFEQKQFNLKEDQKRLAASLFQ